MSTKAQRNAARRALEIGPAGMTPADVRRKLERVRYLDLGGDDGVHSHHDGGLNDDELVGILGELEVSGDARRDNGLWYFVDSLAPPSN